MPTATITSKGQVTIPREVRDKLDLHPGDRVEFRIESDGAVRVVPETVRADTVFGMLGKRTKRRAATVEEMDRLVSTAMRRAARG